MASGLRHGIFLLLVPASAWPPAVEPGGETRDGAWVAEIDVGSDCLTGRPKGLRLIVRKEHPYPGAQLRLTGAEAVSLLSRRRTR
ncbi:hypothetical protein GCM10011428_71550 [Streptomyces violaceus]